MMNKYYKNFILCGDIDYYCLLCQENFQSIPDVDKHLRWEEHRKRFKGQTYFPKLRKEFISKVANTYYYCEVCNVASSDIVTVTEHINKEEHKAMKNNPKTEIKNFIGQYNSNSVVINKVIIDIEQWHSIVDDKCLLCNINVPYYYIDEHTESEDHIIKLIQSETKYEDGRCYRKINSDNYHCFTCKRVFSGQNFDDHLPNCENADEIKKNKLKEVGSKPKNYITGDLEKELINTLKEFFYIEEYNDFATCKYCSIVVPLNFLSMIEHMKGQHDNQQVPEGKVKTKGSDESSEGEVVYREVIDNGKRRAELAKYGKIHSIKMNYNGSRGWCMLCDKYLSAHKNIFKEHTKGAIHRGHLELQDLKKAKKRSCRKYKSKSILQYRLEYACDKKAFLINMYYCIDVLTFFFLRQIENDPHYKKTKCYACNELFPQGQERDHCMNPKHMNNFMAANVAVVSAAMTDQFFREIRPNLFHCGFCNQTIPFLSGLYHHYKNEKHEILHEQKIGFSRNTIEIKTKPDDVYTQLVHHGYANI